MPEQMGLDGPYLTIAVLCEKVLEEKDGVPSLIRIVERFNITGQAPSMQPTVISPMLVIGLKAGIFRGQAVIQVQPVPPSGRARHPEEKGTESLCHLESHRWSRCRARHPEEKGTESWTAPRRTPGRPASRATPRREGD